MNALIGLETKKYFDFLEKLNTSVKNKEEREKLKKEVHLHYLAQSIVPTIQKEPAQK